MRDSHRLMAVSAGRDVCVLSGGAKNRKSGEDARKTSKVEIDEEGAESQSRDVVDFSHSHELVQSTS